MKAKPLFLLLPCVLLLTGCLEHFHWTAEIQSNGQPGGSSVRLGGIYTPPPNASPSGKEPVPREGSVGKAPVEPALPVGWPRDPTPMELEYFRQVFGKKTGEPMPPIPDELKLPAPAPAVIDE